MFALSPYTHTLIRGRKEKGRKKDRMIIGSRANIESRQRPIILGRGCCCCFFLSHSGRPSPYAPQSHRYRFLFFRETATGKRDGGENANFQLFFRDRLSRSAPKPFCSGFVVWFLLRERLAAEQKTFPYVMPPSESTFFFLDHRLCIYIMLCI